VQYDAPGAHTALVKLHAYGQSLPPGTEPPSFRGYCQRREELDFQVHRAYRANAAFTNLVRNLAAEAAAAAWQDDGPPPIASSGVEGPGAETTSWLEAPRPPLDAAGPAPEAAAAGSEGDPFVLWESVLREWRENTSINGSARCNTLNRACTDDALAEELASREIPYGAYLSYLHWRKRWEDGDPQNPQFFYNAYDQTRAAREHGILEEIYSRQRFGAKGPDAEFKSPVIVAGPAPTVEYMWFDETNPFQLHELE